MTSSQSVRTQTCSPPGRVEIDEPGGAVPRLLPKIGLCVGGCVYVRSIIVRMGSRLRVWVRLSVGSNPLRSLPNPYTHTLKKTRTRQNFHLGRRALREFGGLGRGSSIRLLLLLFPLVPAAETEAKAVGAVGEEQEQ